MEDLIEKLMVYGFPEECAEGIITLFVNDGGIREAEEYVREIERNLYVD